jgi:gamma-glutamylaminecyclotransferase
VWYSKANVLEDHLVAVYGTLKKGYSNYNRFLTSSKFIASGQTKDKYPLIISGLPYLIEDSGKGHNVEVDVFKVSDTKLADLDRLEGHPIWYKRKQIPIEVKGKTLMCWIYFNIKEKADGKVWHKSYKQNVRPYSYYFEDEIEESSHVDLFPKYQRDKNCEWIELMADDSDESEFDVENELPVCVECYHDLEFDGFANYHCCGCDAWFAEDEVLYYKS